MVAHCCSLTTAQEWYRAANKRSKTSRNPSAWSGRYAIDDTRVARSGPRLLTFYLELPQSFYYYYFVLRSRSRECYYHCIIMLNVQIALELLYTYYCAITAHYCNIQRTAVLDCYMYRNNLENYYDSTNILLFECFQSIFKSIIDYCKKNSVYWDKFKELANENLSNERRFSCFERKFVLICIESKFDPSSCVRVQDCPKD